MQNFSVAILESFGYGCYLALAHHLDIPVVTYYPFPRCQVFLCKHYLVKFQTFRIMPEVEFLFEKSPKSEDEPDFGKGSPIYPVLPLVSSLYFKLDSMFVDWNIRGAIQ